VPGFDATPRHGLFVPQELAGHVRREIAKWAKDFNSAGIKLN
jgi:hypothetical protein